MDDKTLFAIIIVCFSAVTIGIAWAIAWAIRGETEAGEQHYSEEHGLARTVTYSLGDPHIKSSTMPHKSISRVFNVVDKENQK